MNYNFLRTFVCLALYKHVLPSPVPVCMEPENIDQIYRNLTYRGYLDYSLPPNMNKCGDSCAVQDIKDEQYLFGRQDCPNSQLNIRLEGNTPLSERSTCPYYFVTTHDPKRYPATITEARCACARCLDFSGLSPRNVCEAVYREIQVIVKTTCENNTWKYEARAYRRQESCTCTMRKEVTENQDESSNTETVDTNQPTPM